MNNIQQVYKDRVTELTNRNAALESDCQVLRQELGDLQRRVSQAEAAQQQAQTELDATNRRGRYHPYGQEARRAPVFPAVLEPGHGMSPLGGHASTFPTACNRRADSSRMNAGGTGGGRPYPQAPPTHEELMQSSLRARPGRPGPSVENHPRSAWYGWFRSSAARRHPPVLPNENTEWLPDLPLPGFALKCMGPEAEQREDERVEQAIRDKTAKRVTPTPLRDDYQPPDFGPWGPVDITTVNQAHNLRHCGVHGRDLFAARLYRHLIVVYQADPTARREQGIAYLLRSWSANASRLPFERGSSNSTTRRNEHKRAQKAAERDTIPAGTTPSPTTVPTTATPSKPHPVDLSSIHWVPAAVIPSKAWGARALSGLQRQLDVSMKASDVVKAFAVIPTSLWPLAMRDANGLFPSREGNVFCTPNENDALAEVFITSILPIIPATFTEKYAESAFFRGVTELFSLRELYPWIFKHGKYNELLVEEPSPYPYDCTNLGLHHVVTWVHCCGIGNHSSLRDAIHTYAFNTRHRLEGRHSGVLPSSFTTFPMRTADILKPVNIPLITSADTLFNLPKASYGTTDAPCGTAVPTTMVKMVPAPTEDVTMSPVPN